MAGKIRQIYWDTNLFLYYLNSDSRHLDAIEALLTQADGKSLQIVTSVLTQFEAAFITDDLLPDPAFAHESRIKDLLATYPKIAIAAFSEETAERARTIRRWQKQKDWGKTKNEKLLKVEPLDILHMATAMEIGASEIHTGDEKWFAYFPMVGIPILHPPYPAGVQLSLVELPE